MHLSDSEYRALIELSLVHGIGINRIKNLYNKFNSFSEILKTNINLLKSVDGISVTLAERIISRNKNDDFINQQFDKMLKYNCKIISLWDDDYPELLKQIYDPPPFFFYKGNLFFENNFNIAIVGTRFPSQYGILTTENLTTELVENNFLIISGLARGIDTIAHKSTLKLHGNTIAVLGCGLDVIYPPENKLLYEEISSTGCLISEFYFGTKPDPKNFPRRNRIISGLANGVVIIESSIKGGAIITAEYAIEQNRDLFCIPGNISNIKSTGTNFLIKNSGAKLVQSVNDILEEYSLPKKDSMKNIAIQLTIFEQMIFDNINENPIHIDQLADKLSIPIPEILLNLLNLEFKNLIRQLPGKYFIRQN